MPAEGRGGYRRPGRGRLPLPTTSELREGALVPAADANPDWEMDSEVGSETVLSPGS